jgi:hypothetical protein
MIYRVNSVVRQKNGVIRMWVKWIFDAELARKRREEFAETSENEVTRARWLKFSKTLQLLELDCPMQRFRMGQTIHYDSDGSPLLDTGTGWGNWTEPVPDTIAGEILSVGCKLERGRRGK